MLEYQLHNESTSLSLVFGELERNREALNIEEYSVSQTTLDQVIKIFLENTQIFFLTGFPVATFVLKLDMILRTICRSIILKSKTIQYCTQSCKKATGMRVSPARKVSCQHTT